MRLDSVAKAKQTIVQENHSILLYGPPKSGKTQLVGTAAKIPAIERIWWFDGENGSSTLTRQGLTDEELKKIILFKIPDTREEPRFIETVLKALTSKNQSRICDVHGRINCPDCAKIPTATYENFLLSECTHKDLVVIDSGSALGTSALNAACMGKDVSYKPLLDDYGYVSKLLSDACLVIQQCKNTNFVVITHELLHEGEDKVERIYPLFGSKQFSINCGKFFGTVVYCFTKLGKHSAASSSTYKPNLITGSRLQVALEKEQAPSMTDILVKGGVL
jgi:hypothetical protein